MAKFSTTSLKLRVEAEIVTHEETCKEMVLPVLVSVFFFFFLYHNIIVRNDVKVMPYLQIHNYFRDAAKNSDKIKNIPRVPEIILQEQKLDMNE